MCIKTVEDVSGRIFMKWYIYGFSTMLFAVFFSAEAQAACGVFEVAKGDVKLLSGKTKQLVAVSAGHEVCSGDTVIAGQDSRAKLKMEDGNELNISPNSQIVLENYQFNPKQNKKKVLLNVLRGKVRAATHKPDMYNDTAADGTSNSFEVKTKSAVAGVRGTDFLTSYDARTNRTEVVTFRGKVEVGQIDADGKIVNIIQVGAGQRSIVMPGRPPGPPQPLPPAELNKMNMETSADTGDSKGPRSVPPAPGNTGSSSSQTESTQAQGPAPSAAAESASPSSQTPAKTENRAPAAVPATAASSMVNTSDLSGGEVFRGPSGVPQTGVNAPPIVAPPTAAVPPAIPQCAQCIDAMQKPVKVNVSIRLPGQ